MSRYALPLAVMTACLMACSSGDDPGPGPGPSPVDSVDEPAPSSRLSSDAGPRFDGPDDPGAYYPLAPGRRYAVYPDRGALEAAWRALFVDVGLAEADEIDAFALDDGAVAVGIYLGAQSGGDDTARRHELSVSSYADAAGAPVVQVDTTVTIDCADAAPAVDPSPWLLQAVELPAGTDAADVRFVDVIRTRFTDACGRGTADPAALLPTSPGDTRFSFGYVPEPSVDNTVGYDIGRPSSSPDATAPPDDELEVALSGLLPGLNHEYGLRPADDFRSLGQFVTFSTDAPSDLFEGSIDAEDYVGYLLRLAGPGARDCSPDTDEVMAAYDPSCAARSVDEGTPFFEARSFQGIDSFVMGGAALDGRGRLFLASFNSDPSGGGRPDAGRIHGFECPEPLVTDEGVGCASVPPAPVVTLGDGTLVGGEVPENGPIGFERLLRGDLVALGDETFADGPAYEILRDREALETFWCSLHGGAGGACDPSALPAVDFDERVVAFVTRGVETVAGFDITVEGVRGDNGFVTIDARGDNLPGACPEDGVPKGPFELVSIDSRAASERFAFGVYLIYGEGCTP